MEKFVEVPVNQNLPGPAKSEAAGPCIHPHVRGAVVERGVIPARMLAQLVSRSQVGEEEGAQSFQIHPGQAIKINSLMPILGPQADQVALVADGIVKFVLPEESAQRRVGFVALPAGFDRRADAAFRAEIETEKGVRDVARAEVIDQKIEATQLREMDGLGFPLRNDLRGAAVGAMAEVVDRDFIAVDFRPGCLGVFRRPIAFVARPQAQPPEQEPKGKRERKADERLPPNGHT